MDKALNDPNAIADWAETQTKPKTPRKPAGVAGRVTPDERREIQLAALVEGLNKSQLAERFGRTRETIATLLQGDDFERLRETAWEDIQREAKQGLRAQVIPAVRAWGSAIGIAAGAGNHRAAKDLLEAVGVVERQPSIVNMTAIAIGPETPLQLPVIDVSHVTPASLPPTNGPSEADQIAALRATIAALQADNARLGAAKS